MTNVGSSPSGLQIPATLESPKSSIFPQDTKFPKLVKEETKLKIVPDTNVYISGIIFGGNPRKFVWRHYLPRRRPFDCH